MSESTNPKANEKGSVCQHEDVLRVYSRSSQSFRNIDTVGENVDAKLANPLQGIPQDKLIANAARFARHHGLEDLTEDFKKGALVAQEPES